MIAKTNCVNPINMNNEWFFCYFCAGPSILCPDCNEYICSGACRHATDFYEVEPKYWDVDGIEDRGDVTEDRARELIGEWNDYGRQKRAGCLGIFKKKEIKGSK